MVSSLYMPSNIFKSLVFISLFSVTVLVADNNQRIHDELASEPPIIPLKNALGEKEYNKVMESGKYRYTGNSKCRLCHRKFFLGRKEDPHDYAMKSLEATGHEENSQCLTCHSTGHGIKTGFVNMKQTPRLANVQCEGCHGPGNIHIKLAKNALRNRSNPFISGGFLAGKDSPDKLKKMCTSCHTKRWNKSYHDLDKAYNSYKSANPNTRYK